MRRLLAIILAATLSLTLSATDYNSLWKKANKQLNDDMPRKALSILSTIITSAEKEHDYGQLLAGQMMYARVEAEVTPDSIIPAMSRLIRQAAEADQRAQQSSATNGEKTLAAIYCAILAHTYNIYRATAADTLLINSTLVSSNKQDNPREALYDCALRYPDILAAQQYKQYSKLIIGYTDDKLYNNDLLSVIGHDAKRYAFLRDYYDKHGNRRAACYEAVNQAKAIYFSNDDIKIIKLRRHCDDAIAKYKDLPEGAILVYRYYNDIMDNDDDISDATRYTYLLQQIAHYEPICKAASCDDYLDGLRHALSALTRPQFKVDVNRDVVLSGIRNVNNIKVEFFALDADGRNTLNPSNEKDLKKLLDMRKSKDAAFTILRNYSAPVYLMHADTIAMPRLQTGMYLVHANGAEQDAYSMLSITDLTLLSQPQPDNTTRLAVLSSKTGRPVPYATVVITKEEYGGKVKKTKELVTEQNGETIFKNSLFEPTHIYLYTGGNKDSKTWLRQQGKSEDTAFEKQRFYTSEFRVYESKYDTDHIALFTDRTIYRPGQTLRGSIVVYNSNDEDAITVKHSKKVTVVIRNVEEEKDVFNKTYTTDSHGNAAFECELPATSKNGMYLITCTAANSGMTTTSVRIEDYKRPTYQITLQDSRHYDKTFELTYPKDNVRNDTTVTVRFQAKTYSQLPVQGAKVSYTVKRNNRFYGWYASSHDRLIAAADDAATDRKGNIDITFPLTLPEEAHGTYTFCVHVTVTDKTGETHEEEMSLNVKRTIINPATSVASTSTNKGGKGKTSGKNNGKTSTKNNGKGATAKAPVVRLKNESSFSVSRETFPADGGKVAFTMSRRKPTVRTADMVTTPAHAVYTIYAGKKIIEQGTVDFDTVHIREFSYLKKYGEGLTLTYAWVMDGETHSYSTTIRKPRPEMNLKATWQTFRDRTLPGSRETWTLHVTAPDGKTPVSSATLLATLYDQSLDAIAGAPDYKHNVLHNSYSLNNPWKKRESDRQTHLNIYKPVGSPSLRTFNFAKFDDRILPYRSYYPRYVNIKGSSRVFDIVESRPMMAKSLTIGSADVKGNDEDGGVLLSNVEEVAATAAPNDGADKMVAKMAANSMTANGAADEDSPKKARLNLSGMVRSNFSETAFFTPAQQMPSLTTDYRGNVNITFTLPEAMTTWHFCAFVHDDHMRTVTIDTTCVASKQIIVKPNVPRFLREGDTTTFETTVSNTTQKPLKGDLIMQLVLPGSDSVLWQKTTAIDIPAEESTAVACTTPTIDANCLYSLPTGRAGESLFLRIVARATDGTSDGEQHIIPILPATEDVTTTLAITQHQAGTLSRDLSAILLKNSTDRRLTVTYTPRAVDMLLDAIPSIVKPDHRDALSLATAVYVGNMFRSHCSDSILSVCAKELKALQLTDGQWSWWRGMQGSVYMTTAIAKLLARLNYHGFATAETDRMLSLAMPVLLREMRHEAKLLREYQKKDKKAVIHPSELVTNILYINAILRYNPDNIGKGGIRGITKNDTKDIKYLIGLLEKVPCEYTIYGKAHAAAILALYGKDKKARQFVESMKEYSVCTEEAGRYYDSPRALYSWCNYRIPTEVAAIEALRIAAPEDNTTIDEMQRWLLHEKRTQQWDSSVATADAIYAFVLDNKQVSQRADASAAAITLNGKPLELAAMTTTATNSSVKTAATATNSVKTAATTIADAEQHAMLTINKRNGGTSWAAVTLTQHAPLSSVKTHGTGLSVTRSIVGNDHPQVGDKVTVRLTIQADRDYDFVEVTDNRAACLEPVDIISGYHAAITGGTARNSYSGYYREMRDNHTTCYFDHLAKGTHVIDAEYYIDRCGSYQQGTATVRCTYAPESSAVLAPTALNINPL